MKDPFGDRMKGYEHQARETLDPALPICIRVDGKAFHTWTRRLDRPSMPFLEAMSASMIEVGKQLQGFRVAYTQSDEASFVIMRKTPRSSIWFDGNVQKIASVTASMFTAAFAAEVGKRQMSGTAFVGFKYPAFDARCWNIPKEEADNYIIWRQVDAIRNSVSMLASEHFSDRQLDGKSTVERRAMLAEVGKDWDCSDIGFRYGWWARRHTIDRGGGVIRHVWPETYAPDFRTPEGRKLLREVLWDGVDEAPNLPIPEMSPPPAE